MFGIYEVLIYYSMEFYKHTKCLYWPGIKGVKTDFKNWDFRIWDKLQQKHQKHKKYTL